MRAGIMRSLLLAAVVLPLSGCVAVGYSSGSGWFVWPGGAGVLLLILIVFLVLRRR